MSGKKKKKICFEKIGAFEDVLRLPCVCEKLEGGRW